MNIESPTEQSEPATAAEPSQEVTARAAARGVRESMRTLRANPDFRRLWIGQAISEAGTSISALAFPLLALAMTGSSLNAGLIATVGFIASLIGQIPAGHLADVMDRRVLLVSSDLVRAACLSTVAGFAVSGWYRTDAMLAVTAVNMLAAALAGPAQVRALRSVVSARELVEASAISQGRSYAVELATPTIGGFLFAISRSLPFIGDAVSFVASAMFTARIRTSLAPDPAATRPRFALSFVHGWKVLWHNRLLRWLTAFSASTNLVVSVLVFAVLLGSGASAHAARGLGVTVTLAAFGGLLGSMAGPFLQRRLRLDQVLVGSCLLRLVAVLPAVLVHDQLTRSIAMVVVIFTSPIAAAATGTAKMLAVPVEILGTVTGAAGMIATCAQPLAPLVAGVLLQSAGTGVTFGIVAIAFGLMAAGVAMTQSLRIPAFAGSLPR